VFKRPVAFDAIPVEDRLGGRGRNAPRRFRALDALRRCQPENQGKSRMEGKLHVWTDEADDMLDRAIHVAHYKITEGMRSMCGEGQYADDGKSCLPLSRGAAFFLQTTGCGAKLVTRCQSR
jgi:hypothetical protein